MVKFNIVLLPCIIVLALYLYREEQKRVQVEALDRATLVMDAAGWLRKYVEEDIKAALLELSSLFHFDTDDTLKRIQELGKDELEEHFQKTVAEKKLPQYHKMIPAVAANSLNSTDEKKDVFGNFTYLGQDPRVYGLREPSTIDYTYYERSKQSKATNSAKALTPELEEKFCRDFDDPKDFGLSVEKLGTKDRMDPKWAAEMKRKQIWRYDTDQNKVYVARPIVVTESCLACHFATGTQGTQVTSNELAAAFERRLDDIYKNLKLASGKVTEDHVVAVESLNFLGLVLMKTGGYSNTAFNWKPGEIVGVRIAEASVDEISYAFWAQQSLVLGSLCLILNFGFYYVAVRPLNRLASWVDRLFKGEIGGKTSEENFGLSPALASIAKNCRAFFVKKLKSVVLVPTKPRH